MKPGVQKPHCDPWHATSARCAGCSAPVADFNASTVNTALPATDGSRRMHALTGFHASPGRSAAGSASTTVHAPQSPSAQPSLVPVSRRAPRRNSSSVVCGATPSTATGAPLSRKRNAARSGSDAATAMCAYRGARTGGSGTRHPRAGLARCQHAGRGFAYRIGARTDAPARGARCLWAPRSGCGTVTVRLRRFVPHFRTAYVCRIVTILYAQRR